MGPLLLTSFYLSPIWGGSRIARTRGIDWSDDDRHGEAFDVSAHPTTMGVVHTVPPGPGNLYEGWGTFDATA